MALHYMLIANNGTCMSIYPRREYARSWGLNVVNITVSCCLGTQGGYQSIDEDETQRGGIRMTGKVKAKYGRRAKSEDAPRLDVEDGTTGAPR
jgi:hypothetical protein